MVVDLNFIHFCLKIMGFFLLLGLIFKLVVLVRRLQIPLINKHIALIRDRNKRFFDPKKKPNLDKLFKQFYKACKSNKLESFYDRLYKDIFKKKKKKK